MISGMKRLRNTLWHEVKEILPATIFFLAVFHMISVTKLAVLEQVELTVLRTSAATVAALLVAKASLIVEKIKISELFRKVLWHNIIWKAFLFYLVTLIFHIAETLISQYLENGGLSLSMKTIQESETPAYFLVVQMWLAVSILLFTSLREIVGAVGSKEVQRLLTTQKEVALPAGSNQA